MNDHGIERYKRQIALESWGEDGQERLATSTVFIAGAGGLGSAVLLYLAAAGVGNLRIVDRDVVELSNLNRQILHNDERLGTRKADSAALSLRTINPTINIHSEALEITRKNIHGLAAHPNLVIDCLDNFDTRYILNEYCCENHIPLIHAGLWGMSGQATFIQPPETPCLKCIFPHAPKKAVVPVVGATAGIIGSIQALEALKYLTGMGTALAGKMLSFDGMDMSIYQLNLESRENCSVCGKLHSFH